MTYLEFEFHINPKVPATEILIAELGALGFESFVEKEEVLLAYIPKNFPYQFRLEELLIVQNPDFEINWSIKEIEQRNWNAEWEKNFQPIDVGKACRVRAPFHPKVEVDHDIVIEPKMSFGTGHHETTFMMLKLLLEEPMASKKALDMGCGTGVLGILAEMLGAKTVDAIDIDPWSFENTQENIERNHCRNITAMLGDSNLLGTSKYDVILANINRNVLLEDIPVYVANLVKGGALFLSGFYSSDLDMISSKCEGIGLRFEKKLSKNDWVAAKYVH